MNKKTLFLILAKINTFKTQSSKKIIMLSNNEIIVIILSGFIGAILVLLTTYFGFKYGSISGLITTIPTNTLVSLIGITINTDNYNVLQRSIYGTLILSYCAFIYLILFWIYFPPVIQVYRYPILTTTFFGIGFYSLITSISYKYLILELTDQLSNQELLTLALLSVFKYYYFTSIHKYIYVFKEEIYNKDDKIKSSTLIKRFITTFILISLIVFIGKLNQDIAVIISCFPLLSIINSIILWKQTNNAILVAQLNSNILIGGTTIYMYVMSYAFLLSKINLYLNVFVSLVFSMLIYNTPIYLALKKINNIENKKEIIISEI